MVECRLEALQLCAGHAMIAHHVLPAVLDLPCHYAGQISGFVRGKAEEHGGLKRQLQRSGESLALDDGCLEQAMALGLRVHVKQLRQAPLAFAGIDKAVVLEVIVGV